MEIKTILEKVVAQEIAIGILLFNRPDFAKSILEQIKSLKLSGKFQIYINIDRGRSDSERLITDQVYDMCKSYNSSLRPKIFYQDQNKGLKASVIDIVRRITLHHERFIILEDDLVLSPKAIGFFEKTLEKYSQDPKITQISGFSYPNLSQARPCTYIASRACSWGWASWKSKFPIEYLEDQERSISLLDYVRSIKAGIDLPVLMYKQLHKSNFNSWATLLNIYQIKKRYFTIYPSRTLISCQPDAQSTHGSENIALWQSGPFDVDIDIETSVKIGFQIWVYILLFYIYNKLIKVFK